LRSVGVEAVGSSVVAICAPRLNNVKQTDLHEKEAILNVSLLAVVELDWCPALGERHRWTVMSIHGRMCRRFVFPISVSDIQ
jgi:hypothetical protein